MVGEVEAEDGVLVIKRLHVEYRLELDADQVETAERAHEVHHSKCPVYRTLFGCIEISTELTTVVNA